MKNTNIMRKIFSLLAIAFLAVATFVSLTGLAHADQQTNPQFQQEQSFQRNNDQRFQDQCYSQNNENAPTNLLKTHQWIQFLRGF
jgi:hypothetical protein